MKNKSTNVEVNVCLGCLINLSYVSWNPVNWSAVRLCNVVSYDGSKIVVRNNLGLENMLGLSPIEATRLRFDQKITLQSSTGRTFSS
jgi:hypothetical protein